MDHKNNVIMFDWLPTLLSIKIATIPDITKKLGISEYLIMYSFQIDKSALQKKLCIDNYKYCSKRYLSRFIQKVKSKISI